VNRERGEVLTIDLTEIEALIKRLDQYPKTPDRDLQERLLQLLIFIIREIQNENGSIKRLRRLIWGKQAEKQFQSRAHKAIEGDKARDDSAPRDDSTSNRESEQRESHQQERRQSAPGHGRLGADQYEASTTVECKHHELHPGDRCPHAGCRGRIYDTRDPQILIRLEGRPVIGATRFEQQVLRCSACQARFAARLPEGVPPEKYDASADVSIALMKYGLGMPWHRLRRLQELMGVPLPESTQFERCEQLADRALPVYLELERQAAAGDVVHGDDTGVKILSYMKENLELGEKDRKGMHTTGIGGGGGRPIALYASGRRHAGENLAQLLRKRPAGLGPPIVMADAEAKNWTGDFEQVVSKCLQHGRRQFTEIAAEFPAECRRVLDDLSQVYRNEAETRAMTSRERLLYHQEKSKPVLTELRKWCERQFDERLVEPNSNLGRAIQYLLRHWSGLTRFVEVEGAPVDNNFVERVLKRAVLLRKNSLFYKTSHGAAVGDILMSLIETCALNKVNPFEYLATLVRESARVRQSPGEWLPWNYKERKSKAA